MSRSKLNPVDVNQHNLFSDLVKSIHASRYELELSSRSKSDLVDVD